MSALFPGQMSEVKCVYPSASTGQRLDQLRVEARLESTLNASLRFCKDQRSIFEVHVIAGIARIAIVETRPTLTVSGNKIGVSRAVFLV